MALIEYRREGPIAYVTLNRPEKLNALTDEMVIELKEVLFQLDDDPDAMVGILSGNGRAFCSGADVVQRQLRSREEMERLGSPQGRGSHLEDLMFRFVRWKPLIAAVHGHVMGAGLYLAMISEMIVAAEGTRFQITETSRGWAATNFWSLLMQRTPGGFATDVMLTGRFWTAEEGLRHNAVDRLVPEGQHVTAARELVETHILQNPPLVTRAIVEARRGYLEEVELKARNVQNKRLHVTEDFHESARAFKEKRKPVFRGR